MGAWCEDAVNIEEREKLEPCVRVSLCGRRVAAGVPVAKDSGLEKSVVPPGRECERLNCGLGQSAFAGTSLSVMERIRTNGRALAPSVQ